MEITLEPLNITKELILSKISEEELFEHYGVKVTKGLFCSKIRTDNRPTCSLYKNTKGRLIYRDFGTGQSFDCFGYVQELFGCSYYMALQIIANDFGIIHRPDLKPNKAKLEYSGIKFEEKQAAIIQVQTRDFNEREVAWWNKYGVSLDTLNKFKVFPVDAVWLNDHLFYQNVDNKYVFGYYGGTKSNIEQWRIYWPGRTKYKFISNWKATQIQGAHMLPESGDVLIITKALKDVMVLYEYGIPAIAPCSENLFITEAQYDHLKERFKWIGCLYDMDIPGVQAEKRIKKEFPDVHMLLLPWDTAKDISDYRKIYGHRKTLDLINKAKEYYGKEITRNTTEA